MIKNVKVLMKYRMCRSLSYPDCVICYCRSFLMMFSFLCSLAARFRHDKRHLRDRLLQEGWEGPASCQMDGPRIFEGRGLHSSLGLLVSRPCAQTLSSARRRVSLFKERLPNWSRDFNSASVSIVQVLWRGAVGDQYSGWAALPGAV